jgi:hypothetical protein
VVPFLAAVVFVGEHVEQVNTECGELGLVLLDKER